MVRGGKRCNVGIMTYDASKADIEADNRGGRSCEIGGHMVILQLGTSDRVWIQSYSCNYTTQKKVRISGEYLFALLTLNYCRL